MDYRVVFVLLLAGVLLLLATIVYYDRKFGKNNLEYKRTIDDELRSLKSSLKSYELSVSEYRTKYIQQVESYNTVHEHLAKITEQMRILRKNQNTLRMNMVRRYEVVVPKNYAEVMQKLNDMMDREGLSVKNSKVQRSSRQA